MSLHLPCGSFALKADFAQNPYGSASLGPDPRLTLLQPCSSFAAVFLPVPPPGALPAFISNTPYPISPLCCMLLAASLFLPDVDTSCICLPILFSCTLPKSSQRSARWAVMPRQASGSSSAPRRGAPQLSQSSGPTHCLALPGLTEISKDRVWVVLRRDK